jgi:formate hydrogenlyase subunit 4
MCDLFAKVHVMVVTAVTVIIIIIIIIINNNEATMRISSVPELNRNIYFWQCIIKIKNISWFSLSPFCDSNF